jgi:hypothetical protein
MLQEFLKHLNGIHKNIKFTMEIEKNGVLPFLDVLVTKWMGEWHSWAHSTQETYTYGRLPPHQAWAPPSSEKCSRSHTSLTGSHAIWCGKPREELQQLKQVVKHNRHSHSDIRQALQQNLEPKLKKKKIPQVLPWCCFIRPSATKLIDRCRNVVSKWFTSQRGKLRRCWGLPNLD